MHTVTSNALVKRINRKLAHEGEVLKAARTYTTDLGWHYIVDLHTGALAVGHAGPLDVLGRELGVLKDYEQLSAA